MAQKTPLITKLGIKPGHRVCFVQAPSHYHDLLGGLPEDVVVEPELTPSIHFIHYFSTELGQLAVEFQDLKASMDIDGMLWVSWPKKTSKIKSDLNFNRVQELGLMNGLVDCKVCAVDEDWSAVKFVYRLEDRKALRKSGNALAG